jgi:hypothetical protein
VFISYRIYSGQPPFSVHCSKAITKKHKSKMSRLRCLLMTESTLSKRNGKEKSRMDSTSSPQVSYVVYRMSHTGISAAARGLPDIWLRTIIVLRSRPDFSAAGCLWPPFGRNDSENQSFLCVLRGKMKIRHRFTQIKQDKEGKDKSVKSV